MSSNEPTRSLQRRLTTSLVVACGLLFLLLGLVLDHAMVGWLRAELDRSLASQARALISLSEQEDGVVEFDFVADLMPEFDVGEPRTKQYFQLWLRDGESVRVFERSPSLAGADLERRPGVRDDLHLFDVELPGGEPGRQVQVDFVPQVESDDEEADEDDDENAPGLTGLDPAAPPPGVRAATLGVAQPTRDLEERIFFLRGTLVGGGMLLLLITALLVHFTVRRCLGPVREVSRRVDSLDAGRLDQRIEIEPPAELAPLVAKLNELLARLDAAFERERRFSSDVAHELRTPIAELRSLAEVGERWPDDPFAVRQFFGDARQIAEQMEQVVSQLLAVARSEAGIEVVDEERLHLPTLVAEVLERHADAAEAKGNELAAQLPDDLWLVADAAKLRLVLHNSLTNAVAYAPDGAMISLDGRMEADGFVLEIANPTEGIEEDDLPHVFDRFWRKDETRSQPGSSGLGLALVRSLCELMEIEVDARLEDDAFVLRLRWPRAALAETERRRAS